MEMIVFVLVSAVAVLIGPRAALPANNVNLRHILDLTETYTEALHQNYYVEDVTDLYNNGCGNKFFCKVHEILTKHNRTKDHVIVRNLDVYFNETRVNCTEVLKNVRVTKVEKPILDLLETLKKCIQCTNFGGKINQNA